MWQYLELLQDILDNGVQKGDRTGTGTVSVFGKQLRCNLQEGFPLMTTKKLHFKSIAYELLWFLRGETNIRWLNENGVTIWNEWANEEGNLGPVYGKQWRAWETTDGRVIDQLAKAIKLLLTKPDDRRIIVSAWNPGEIEKMVLPPCHLLFQFYVARGRLSCQMYQRSVDTFLGLPYNIASYALLTMMVAQVAGFRPGELILSLGDTHLYLNHLEQAREQLKRRPLAPPTLLLNPEVTDIDRFTFEDIRLEGYTAHPHIRAAISV